MQLIEQYEVSRITVRQALDKLMKDGYIDRRRGSWSPKDTRFLPEKKRFQPLFLMKKIRRFLDWTNLKQY